MSDDAVILYYKTGDTSPVIVVRFENEEGQIDLSAVDRVLIAFRKSDDPSRRFEGECRVEEAVEDVGGEATTVWRVLYTLAASDTGEAGTYEVEWKIIEDESEPQVIRSIPRTGYETMIIQERAA